MIRTTRTSNDVPFISRTASASRTHFRARYSFAVIAFVTCVAMARVLSPTRLKHRGIASLSFVDSNRGVPSWSGEDAGLDGESDPLPVEDDEPPLDDDDGHSNETSLLKRLADDNSAALYANDAEENSVAESSVGTRYVDTRAASGESLKSTAAIMSIAHSSTVAVSDTHLVKSTPPKTRKANLPFSVARSMSKSKILRRLLAKDGGDINTDSRGERDTNSMKAASDHKDNVVRRARCMEMPDPQRFRIFVAALPPSVYGGASVRDDASATTDSMIRAMWSWSQDSDRRDPYSRIDLRRGVKGVSEGALRRALINGAGRRDSSAAIARQGGAVIERAVLLTESRMAALEAVEAAPERSRSRTDTSLSRLAPFRGNPASAVEYEYSTVSWRDLERVVVAGLLSSPYVRVVDMRNWTAAELQESGAAVVFIPFPLSRLRGVTSKAKQLVRVVTEYVPTLWDAPQKHAFAIARIIRDMAILRSLSHTLRPIVRSEPWRRAQYWSFEPFWTAGLPKLQRVLPYPGSVGRRWRNAPGAIDDGTSGIRVSESNRDAGIMQSMKFRGSPPLWAPADPMHFRAYHSSSFAVVNRCDPLSANGSLRGVDDSVPDGCSPADQMAALSAERPFLVTFMGAPRGSMPERVTMFAGLRACASCAAFDVRSAVFSDGFGMPWLYEHSLFCAQPHGDSPSRKALFDALLYGCIPIVLDKRDGGNRGRAPVLPYAKLLPWDDIALRVTRSEWFGSGVVAAARRLPAARIRAMQLAIARHAHLLAFGLPAGPDIAALTGKRLLANDGSRDDGERRCAIDALDMLLLSIAPHAHTVAPSHARHKRGRNVQH